MATTTSPLLPPTGTAVLEFSLDQRVLLAGSKDGLIVVWNMDDFTVQHILTGHSGKHLKDTFKALNINPLRFPSYIAQEFCFNYYVEYEL